MSYYTGKGDSGTTKLFNCPRGMRISKDDPIFELLGGLDELNSYLGVCRAQANQSRLLVKKKRKDLSEKILNIQQDLFIIQAEVAGSQKRLPENKVAGIEDVIEKFSTRFPEVKSFIIPGESTTGASLDVARTISRRIERQYIKTVKEKDRNAVTAKYLNRLSSILYVLARFAVHSENRTETPPSYR